MPTNTAINDLAATIAEQHGIDSQAAAVAVVRTMVDQIADDADLWDPESERFTPAGVDVVTGAVAQSYAHGYHSTEETLLLEDLGDVARELERAEAHAMEVQARRDEIVRRAMKTSLPRAEIASAANVKEARLYQIRDGRR